jgi:glycosyltransferase involved in cell wall biosynthesis
LSSALRLVYLATDPVTAYRLMDGQLGYMRRRGFDVTVVTAPGSLLQRAAQREGVRAIGVPMSREISPAGDLLALARLVKVLSQLRPTIVNAGTPKAGLLGVIAARLCRVPVVVYLLRGLRFEGAMGVKRLLLAATEHVTGTLADRVFVNSESLRSRFTALGCAPADKTWVPAFGSSNGVDVARFAVTDERQAWAASERQRLGIDANAVVVGFVGRFVRDKGLVELLEAFRLAAAEEPRLRLLLVGDHDGTDPLPEAARRILHEEPRITLTGFVDEPARYYALMNVFAFPSYREGFPNAPLEAAAAGLPVVAFDATGTRDALVDGETGVLLRRGDIAAFAQSLLRYAQTPALALAHGQAGQRRVVACFQQEVVWSALEQEYRRLAAQARRPAAAD